MTNKQESTMAVIAALLVMFSAMLNPIVSVILAVTALVSFAVYKYQYPKRTK